jgi:hypothetical protein
MADKSSALHSPSPDRGHVGLDPCLVDKHQPFGINPALPGFPATTLTGNTRPGLLKSEECFF